MTYDIRFFENIVFYDSPGNIVNIKLKDIEKRDIGYVNNLQLHNTSFDSGLKILDWVSFPNIHLYDEVYIEIQEGDKMLYEELFFRGAEQSYIKKEDLTIVVKCDNIERMIKYYSKYGKVQYDMNNIDTKYVLILNKYLLNVPYFLNKMFYNYKTISESDDKNVMGYEKNSLEERKIVDNLRFLNEEMWRDK